MRQSSTSRNHRIAAFEPLENRQLFSVTLGSNLVLNPGAEANTGATTPNAVVHPTNWTSNGHPTTAKYGAVAAWPTSTSPGPTSRGSEFFSGGPTDDESDLFQTISVSSIATAIDAKQIHYTLSGWLGGSTSQGDNVTLFANFQGDSGLVGQVLVGPVTPANRGNVTKLLSKTLSGILPTGTRKIQIQLHFQRVGGGYTDAYADNISLVLTKPTTTSTTGTVSGTVFKDANGNGVQSGSTESGLGGWMVYVDTNNNAQYDPGETYTMTSSTGAYSFTFKPGKYILRVQVRSGFYETAPSALEYTATVTAGGNILGDKFGVKAIAP